MEIYHLFLNGRKGIKTLKFIKREIFKFIFTFKLKIIPGFNTMGALVNENNELVSNYNLRRLTYFHFSSLKNIAISFNVSHVTSLLVTVKYLILV